MTSEHGRASTDRRDLLGAGSAGLAALGVYLFTLAPGMVAVVDTPMFQFIGRVLGVAHNPGYPLYVLLTHPFSYLPIGSLAYRINLFSALCAAIAVALVFLIARRLGCRPVVSAAAALGLAFGPVFWSQAIIAEVYALDAAFVAGALLALIAWGRSGGQRPALFFTAVGLVALGFSNRTTILALLPGLALYAWFTHRTMVTRVRSVLLILLLLLGGLLPYVFVLVRSSDPDAYLETRATTLGDLAGAIAGEQWHDRVLTASWDDVLGERVPWLVEQVLAPELTTAGLVLAVIGVAWLVWGRRKEAWPLCCSWLGYVAFALNYDAIDLPVFLIPAILISWLAFAVAAEWLISRARTATLRTLASLLVVMIPAWLWFHNYERVDQSHNTNAALTFDRLFDALPDRSALVREDFLVDRMVMHKVLVDQPVTRPAVEAVARGEAVERARGGDRGMFAFPKSAAWLRLEGVSVSYEPLPLLDGRLPDFLARQPDGLVVAVAVPASLAGAFVTEGSSGLNAIGAPNRLQTTDEGGLVVVGVTGASPNAVTSRPTDHGCLSYAVGQAIGNTGMSAPAAVTLEATRAEAAVHLDGRDVVRSAEGAVVAIWGSDGGLVRTMVLEEASGFRVPVVTGPLSVFPVRGVNREYEIKPAWGSVTDAGGAGTVLIRANGTSSVEVLVAADSRFALSVVDRTRETVVSIDEARPADVSAASGEPAGRERRYAYRLSIAGPGSAMFALGGIPDDIVARATGGGAATISSVDTAGLMRVRERSTEVLYMSRDDQAQLVGPGWSDVEVDAVGPLRWMVKEQASLLLPLSSSAPRRLQLQARGASAIDLSGIHVRLNGRDLGARVVVPRWRTLEWEVPAGVIRAGTNTLTLTVDEDTAAGAIASTRQRVAVSEVRLLRELPGADRGVQPSASIRPCS